MQQFIFTRPFEVETKGDEVFLDGLISTSDRDLVNDVITENCLKSMLEQIRERNVKIDLEHESFKGDTDEQREINKTLIPVGRIIDGLIEQRNKLRVKAKLNRFHRRFEEAKGSIMDKHLDAFSIAFIPKKVHFENKGGETIRLLDDLTLLNVALTGNPVNTYAQIKDIMLKSMDSLTGDKEKDEEDDESETDDKNKEDPVKNYKAEKRSNPEVEQGFEVKENKSHSLNREIKSKKGVKAMTEEKGTTHDIAPENTKAHAESEKDSARKLENEGTNEMKSQVEALKAEVSELKESMKDLLAEREKTNSKAFVEKRKALENAPTVEPLDLLR